MSRPLALVTGANRGIGLEVVRQLADEHGFDVLLGARDADKGRDAADSLDVEGAVHVLVLDVADQESVEAAARQVGEEHGRLDVLVNNAGVDYDTDQTALGADLDRVRRAYETNVLGAWRTAQAFAPLLRQAPHGRLVNVSSGAGALTDAGGGAPGYSTAKAALNMLTVKLAAELRDDGVLVDAVCPGWVATEMGGSGGRPLRDGGESVVWAATLADGGPTGGFFRDGRRIDW